MEDTGGTRFVYFLVGLGFGALLGVLFAPQSGEETRKLITDRAEEGREYLLRKSHQVQEQTAEYIDRGKEAVSKQRDQIAAAIEAGKQAYRTESQAKETSS
ncbi:MAG: YtxH domain-containing protein [Acidobacteria bacterium]|nr:YtxH domain-containing protein [Acidobacteriota bacterium]